MIPQTVPDTLRKTVCRYCNSKLAEAFLDLGSMPLANSFLTEEQAKKDEFSCPLSLSYCSACGLVQLTHVVPPDLMFSNYLYVSSTTRTFQEHFLEYAKMVRNKIQKKENLLAVDIGSNDGLLLNCYQREGMKVVGIEPAKNLSEAANRNGFTTLNRYFDSECVEKILHDYGAADVISANNVFAHIDDIQSVCRNVQKLLSSRGIFVIEFPYLLTMIDQMLFDMIYHEHLSYISITALKFLLKKHDLEIFDVVPVSSHGGSLRVFIQKKGAGFPQSQKVAAILLEEQTKGIGSGTSYRNFAVRVAEWRETFVQMMVDLKAKGKSISGYGAPAKANTIINYCHLNSSHIDYIVDDNPLKQGKFSPGAKIPIIPSAQLTDNPTDYVIIFAWNFAQEIIQKIGHLKSKGVQFIIPLPRPEIV